MTPRAENGKDSIDESTLSQAHGTDCTMDPAQRDRHFHSCYEVAPNSLINKIFLFNVVATPWRTAPAHSFKIFPVSCIFGKDFIDVYKKISLRNYPTGGKWKIFYR